MKATGIVRRIDDLGRVVIPKEIRRTMRIREGDPLEIYTSAEGEVIFRKYSALGEMSENAAQVAEIIGRLSGCPVVIFDRDQVIAVSGVPKKELLNPELHPHAEAQEGRLYQKHKDAMVDSSVCGETFRHDDGMYGEFITPI